MTCPAPRPEVAAAVAAHAGGRLEAELAGGRNPWRRPTIARSPWLTPALARRLARSSQAALRRAVAGNPATPADLLTRLLADELEVASTARANPSTPYAAVAAASTNDGTPSKHCPAPLTDDMVAHPDCPADVLLAALADPWLNEHALRHRNLPAAIVHDLAATGTTDLAPVDVYNFDTRYLLESPHLTHPEALRLMDAHVPRTTGTDGSSWLQWMWCQHPNADPDWLTDLADRRFDSADQGAIARIAQNPATPGPVLARIVARHAHRDLAAANPSCPPDALHAALDALDPSADRAGSTTDGQALLDVDTTKHGRLLAAIATSSTAPSDVLDRLPVATLRTDEHRYTFTIARTTTAMQARIVLALAPTFTGTLTELVTAASDISAPTTTTTDCVTDCVTGP